MSSKALKSVVILFLLAGVTYSQKPGEPKLEPIPSTPTREILIKQGIAKMD